MIREKEINNGVEETAYGLSQTDFIPAMVKAIQELAEKVETLEQMIGGIG